MNINRVLLSGNLTRDPELRGSDGQVCVMRLAVNGRIKEGGEWVDKANYFDVVVFGAQGENCAKYLARGRAIMLDGRLDWREWEHEGQKRQAVQVIAENVQFLDSGNRDERRGDAPAVSTPVGTAPVDDDIPF